MAGQNVYGKCKSQELITALNIRVFCSSCNKIRVCQILLITVFLWEMIISYLHKAILIQINSICLKWISLNTQNNCLQQKWKATLTPTTTTAIMTLTQTEPQQSPSKPNLNDFDLLKNTKDRFEKFPCQNPCKYRRESKDLPSKKRFSGTGNKNKCWSRSKGLQILMKIQY